MHLINTHMIQKWEKLLHSISHENKSTILESVWKLNKVFNWEWAN